MSTASLERPPPTPAAIAPARVLTAALWAAGAALLAMFALAAGAYAMSPGLLDHVEPSVITGSWLWATGHPLYTAADSVERYSLLYGPGAYVAFGLWMKLVGPSLGACKVLAAAAALAGLAATAVAAVRLGASTAMAVLAAGVMAAAMLTLGHRAFWVRPEPLTVLAVAVAMLGATMRGWAAAAVVGIATGVAANMKIHAVAYCLPAVAMLWVQAGGARTLVAMGVAAVLAAGPFALPGVSIANYVALLRLAGKHGLEARLMVTSATVIGLMLLPAALAVAAGGLPGRRWAVTGVAGAVAMVAVLVMGSKTGSGEHHLMPMLPMGAVAGAVAATRAVRDGRWRRPVGAVLVVAAVVGCGVIATYGARGALGVWRQGEAMRLVGDEADLGRAVAMAQAGGATEVRMGFGTDDKAYPVTFVRPMLAFRGWVPVIDPAVEMDAAASGVRVAGPETVAPRGGVWWLVPRGQRPFALHSFMPPFARLYPESLEAAFVAGHRKAAETTLFDLYRPVTR